MKFIKKFVCFGLMLMGIIFSSGCGTAKGTFYTLSEAYDNGWLTKESLQNISFYHSGKADESFVPIIKNPEILSSKIEKSIKQTYLNDVLKMPNGSFEKIVIWNYYGTYNDCIAVGVTDKYNVYDLLIEPEYHVAGVIFYNIATSDIRIWRENK